MDVSVCRRKNVLFRRKEPKDFCTCACISVGAMALMLRIASTDKSLLVLFFRKEHSFLCL
jgi:hypothetical protein